MIDPGTLKAMSVEMYLNLLLMMIQTIALIIILAAIAGFAIYLIGIAWLCSSETRQPARCRMHSVPEPPEPDEYDLLVTLACLSDSVAGEAMDRDLRVMRHA
jgi:hypothetical protein